MLPNHLPAGDIPRVEPERMLAIPAAIGPWRSTSPGRTVFRKTKEHAHPRQVPSDGAGPTSWTGRGNPLSFAASDSTGYQRGGGVSRSTALGPTAGSGHPSFLSPQPRVQT